MIDYNHSPPHSIDAEYATLGSFMLDESGDVRDAILSRISSASFFSEDARLVFTALETLHRGGRKIDPVTLAEELRRTGKLDEIGGTSLLATIVNTVPTASNGAAYAEIVRRHYRSRWIIRAGIKAAQAAMDPQADNLQIARYLRADLDELLRRAVIGRSRHGGAAELQNLLYATAKGERRAVPFSHRCLSDQTKALMPGTITIEAGLPGDGKTFLKLQEMIGWAREGVPCSVMMLEGSRAWHLNRVLAILAGNANLLDDEFVKMNPELVAAVAAEHRETIEAVGEMIHTTEHVDSTLAGIGDWIAQQAKQSRVLIVDPISLAEAGKDRWIEDNRLMRTARRAIESTGSSLVLVSHPKINPNRKGPLTMDDLAGGAVYSRAAETIIVLQKLAAAKRFNVTTSTEDARTVSANRLLRILKARNGRGSNLQIAFEFMGGTLRFHELGIVMSEAKVPEGTEQRDNEPW